MVTKPILLRSFGVRVPTLAFTGPNPPRVRVRCEAWFIFRFFVRGGSVPFQVRVTMATELEQSDNHKMTETVDLKCYFKTLKNAQNFMIDISNDEWEIK